MYHVLLLKLPTWSYLTNRIGHEIDTDKCWVLIVIRVGSMCACLWTDAQNALHCLEGMKQESSRQSLIDRLHRDRDRQLHEINQPRQLDKRVSFISLHSVTIYSSYFM